MRERLFVLVVGALALLSSPGIAKPPDDPSGGGGGRTPTGPLGGKTFAVETFTTQSSTVLCEVWRDYYYNRDTGEFIGWAGDPYLKNCESIGGGTSDGPMCPPDDLNCICPPGSKDPSCEGAGPNPPECTPPPQKAGGGNPCAKKPKETCSNCKKKRDEAISANTKAYKRCISTYEKISKSRCESGAWRADPRAPEGQHCHEETKTCDMETYGDSVPEYYVHVIIDGKPVKTKNPNQPKCIASWMNTLNAQQIKDATVAGGIDIGLINASYNGKEVTTTLEGAAGFKNACETWANGFTGKIVSDFDKCATQAEKDEGKTCQ